MDVNTAHAVTIAQEVPQDISDARAALVFPSSNVPLPLKVVEQLQTQTMELTPSLGIVDPIAGIAHSLGHQVPLDNPSAKPHRHHLAAGVKTNIRSSPNRFAFSLIGIVILFGLFAAPAFPNNCPNPAQWWETGARKYETSEYVNQEGLCRINASSMYARGGTGQGITVGVIDTGLFHNWDLWSRVDGKYIWTHPRVGWNGNTDDTDGHGTHVAGIIAARKNNRGTHGVAYNANIFSVRFLGAGQSDHRLAQAVNYMRVKGVRIQNNSFGIRCHDANGRWRGKACLVTHVNPTTLYARHRSQFWTWTTGWMKYSVPAYWTYVANGGVAIYAAGNDWQAQPSIKAGLPYHFGGLEKGWLAVVAVGYGGGLASYSNACGLAHNWCIAAPGTYVNSTSTEYGWKKTTRKSGTSMAAPHVAGALAGLKSMFPNLSYQDVRRRILVSANRTGIYSNRALYGSGLLDLDVASRPIGGTLFPYGGHDHGLAVTTVGAQLILPTAAVSQHIGDEQILVLDGYQRAPFTVPASAFIGAAGGYLSLDDLDLTGPTLSSWDTDYGETALAVSGDDFKFSGISSGRWFVGTGLGAGLMEGFASLQDVPLTHGNYRMAENAFGLALGVSLGPGELYTTIGTNPGGVRTDGGWGIMGWSPRSVLTASFAPKGANYAMGASFASNLAKPSGWNGLGAFNIAGDTVDISYGHNIYNGRKLKAEASARMTHLSPGASSMGHLDDATLAATDLSLSLKLVRNATLNVRWGIEWPLESGEARLRAARAVDESGRLTYKDITMDQADLLKFQKAGLSLKYNPHRNSNYSAGILAVRDGFGETEVLVGAKAEIRF